MRLPLHLALLPVLGVLALGCTGGPGDTGQDSGDWTSSGEHYFEPVGFFVETYAAYDGERLDEFTLDPNDPASTLPPVMMITFAEARYFGDSANRENYSCSWFGVMNVEGLDTLDDPELWAGYAISLTFLETDCDDMDPWEWGERTPTTMLESAFLGVGYREMSSDFEAVIKDQVAESGLRWAQDWEPYVFTMVMGLWDAAEGRLLGSEVDYGFSFKMTNGALSFDLGGDPIPLPLAESEGLPQGLVAAYPYFDMAPSALR